MIAKEYLVARRLANLYWAGFDSVGPYILRWSQFRDLSKGIILSNDEIDRVVKFLIDFGFVMAKNNEGAILWHESEIKPREISELKLYQALQFCIFEENENDIENELFS